MPARSVGVVPARPRGVRHRSAVAAGRPRDAADPRRDRRAAFEPSVPIVEAKLHPPAHRPGQSAERGCSVLLEDAADTPIVPVLAPPGYGKTVCWPTGRLRRAAPSHG